MTSIDSISTISGMFSEYKLKMAPAARNLVTNGKYMLPIMLLMVALSGFRSATYSLDHLQAGGPPIANTLLIAWLNGSVLGPLLLPWLPGKGLAMKGLLVGVLGLLMFPASCFFLHLEPLDVLMALLVIPSVTSLLMGSQWGKEPTPTPPWRGQGRVLSPIQLALVALAAGIWIAARFI